MAVSLMVAWAVYQGFVSQGVERRRKEKKKIKDNMLRKEYHTECKWKRKSPSNESSYKEAAIQQRDREWGS